jgi:hypothetical protein
MQFGFILQDPQGGGEVIVLQAAGVQGPPLHEVPTQYVVVFLVQGGGDALVRQLHVTPDVPLADIPALLSSKLFDVVEFATRQDELHDILNPALHRGSGRFGHGRAVLCVIRGTQRANEGPYLKTYPVDEEVDEAHAGMSLASPVSLFHSVPSFETHGRSTRIRH